MSGENASRDSDFAASGDSEVGRRRVPRRRGRHRSLIVSGLVLLVACGALPLAATPAAAASLPKVTGVSPSAGEAYRGPDAADPGWNTTVTISGTGFVPGQVTGVWFGLKRASAFSMKSDGTISAFTPMDATPGRVDITVQTAAGKSAITPADGFAFVAEIPKLPRNLYPDPNSYSDSSSPGVTYTDWMADSRLVPDSERLSDVSIPGTHDTGTYPASDRFTKTQSMDVPTQLASGMRAFDIRVGENNSGSCSDGLYIFHGDFCMGETFDSVAQQVATYLRLHPTEFVVMRLGNATSPVDPPSSSEVLRLAQSAWNILSGDASDSPNVNSCKLHYPNCRLYQGADQNPTVANLRGKVFVMADFGAAANPMFPGKPYGSIDAEDLGSGSVATVAQILDKWDSVQAHLAKASVDSSGTIFLTHTSTSTGAFPCTFASGYTSCGSKIEPDVFWHDPLWTLLTWGQAAGISGTCNATYSCATMVERHLYQLNHCTQGVGESLCSAYYSGLNMMAEADIVGSDLNGTDSSTNPQDYRQSPQFPGLSKTGIVMTDFAGANLITAIIGANRGNDSVTAYLDRAPDHNGWYTQPVNVRVRCRGVYYTHCPGGNDAIIQTLGQDGLLLSKTITVNDGHGHSATTWPVLAPVDLHDPGFSVPLAVDVNASSATGASVSFGDDIVTNSVYPAGQWVGFELAAPTGSAPKLLPVSDGSGSGLDPTLDSTAPHGASCDLPLGTTELPAGTTTVTCWAQDFAGRRTARSFPIRVRPTMVPAPTVAPNDQGWYNTAPVVVHFTCTGTNNVCPNDQVISREGVSSVGLPATFPKYTTPDGTLTPAKQSVTVQIDLHKPVISNATIFADATALSGAYVNLLGVASDPPGGLGVTPSGIQSLNCTPSGTEGIFRIGNTVVTCHAQDRAGNVSDDTTFTVHVKGAGEQASDLAANPLMSRDATLGNLANSLKTYLAGNQTANACGSLHDFVARVRALSGSTLAASEADGLLTDATTIAGAMGGCPFQGATTTTVSFSPSAPSTGQAVTLTATLTKTANAPFGGYVQFLRNGASLGAPVPVSSAGTAVLTTSFAGCSPLLCETSDQVIIRAQWQGTADHAPSISPSVTVPVGPGATTTQLDASLPFTFTDYFGTYGQPITLTATVAVTFPAAGSPGGTVDFFDNGVLVGSAPVAGGKATLPLTTPLSLGDHSLQARFRPSSIAYLASASTNETAHIAQAATTTTIITPSSTIYGSAPVSVVAKVTANNPSVAVPRGTVTFKVNNSVFGTPVQLDSNGAASITLSNTPAGRRNFSASYTPSPEFVASDASLAQTVTVNTTTKLTATLASVDSGTVAMMSASVASIVGPVKSGVVSFYDGTTQVASRTLSSTASTVTATVPVAVGTHLLTATYIGSVPYNQSTSKTVALSVATPDTTAPVITVGGVTDGANIVGGVAPTFSATDNVAVASLTATLDGFAFTSGTIVSSDGAHTLVVVARDNSGNTATSTVHFTIAAGNNDFNLARTISGASGSVDGSNAQATVEAGEPGPYQGQGPYKTVWYSWTAPQDLWVTLDTCTNTNFAAVLGVWTGTRVDALTTAYPSGSFNYYGCGYSTPVSFAAWAGQTYKIQVDGGTAADSGPFTLTWNSIVPPANDRFANAQLIAGVSGTVNGTVDGAIDEPGEPLLTPYTGGRPNHSVWYTWVAPKGGDVTFDTCGTPFAAMQTVVGVYTGTDLASLSNVGRGEYGCPGGAALTKLTVPVTAGTTYHIQVGTYTFQNPGQPAIVLGWNFVSNDDFANAKPISGAAGSVTGSNVLYTSESNEPPTCVDSVLGCTGVQGPTATAWYRWTAPATGWATISVCNADFSPMMAVYTGSSIDALTRVGDNNSFIDLCGSAAKSKGLYATAGSSYLIQIDTMYGVGNFTLTWKQPPANDDFVNASTLAGSVGSTTGTLAGASAELDEPAPCQGETGCNGTDQGPTATTWYAWTAPATGTVVFDTCTTPGSTSTLLAAYSGTALDALSKLASGDNSACSNGGSRVSFDVTSGQTYRIQVDAASGTPAYTLEWRVSAANDAFVNAQVLTGLSGSIQGTNTLASTESGEPTIDGHLPANTLWYVWTAPSNGTATFDTCTAPAFDSMLGVYTGSAINALTSVASNDDSCGTSSSVTFAVTAGQTYQLQLGSYYSSDTGPFTLTWTVS
jgi:hypothetical protein